MQKSESIKHIAAALITFHLKVEKIKRDATNPFFKKKYATLSNIQENIDVPLSESGLAYSQLPIGEHGLSTILMHAESGEYICADYIMRPIKDDPQGIGSAITYQRRYALCAVLGLNIDDDDDGNDASQPDKSGDVNKPWLNEGTKEFEGAVKKLQAGTTTIPKIKGVMRVSKAVEAKLLAESKR